MAEEKKDILSVLEERKEEAIEVGDVSTAKAIQLKIDYLNSLDDPEDVARIAKNSPEFQNFVGKVTHGGDLEKDAQKALQVAPPKRPERDEKTAKKTITLEELGKIAQSTDGVDEIFDEDSDYNWKNWTTAQVNEYAKKAGMSRGDFLAKVAQLDTERQRHAIANEGVGGTLMSFFTPRRQQDIAEGRDPGFFSTVLDLMENGAQAVPVGRVIGAAGKVGKVIKSAGPAVNAVIENAAVPTIFAYADAAREGNPEEGTTKALEGTMVNFATPRIIGRAINRGKQNLGTAGAAAEKKVKGIIQEMAESFATNKLGKQQYGNRALDFLTGLDTSGTLDKVIQYLPGSAADKASKKREKNKELEKQHTEDVVKDYKNFSRLSDYVQED